ncbi:hypothetical protein OU798_11060 [Prolixibacteraceae bacterium Z1-6]|uniref:Uncharacterized protein n=1 Tax=Draconibacterium aestuarii TaxID=2998507 RepID=A0A9X3F6U5_9BACT|nr:hypothetical protein [Prolixibacteraceae bacterium Z1-6]
MKTKSDSTKTLQLITGIVAVLCLLAMAILYHGGMLVLNLEGILSFVLFLIFLSGFILSWKSRKMAGILIMTCNAGIWILDLYINGYQTDSETGGPSLMFSPVMVIGALFLLEWYKTSKTTVPSTPLQWKFILRVLLINYTVLYFILVLSEPSDRAGIKQVDYTSIPFIINPLLFFIFLAGLIISWKKEFIAGILFLFWCTIFLWGVIAYPEILPSEPWIVSGVPILLQGSFYIKHHYEFRTN